MTPLSIALLLTLTVASATVELPDLSIECAPEVTHRRELLTLDGDPGIWFAEPVAACMAARLALVPELYVLIDRYEAREAERATLDALRERRGELSAKIEDELQVALENALERARRAETDRDKFARRPMLWFALGTALATTLFIAAAAARRSP